MAKKRLGRLPVGMQEWTTIVKQITLRNVTKIDETTITEDAMHIIFILLALMLLCPAAGPLAADNLFGNGGGSGHDLPDEPPAMKKERLEQEAMRKQREAERKAAYEAEKAQKEKVFTDLLFVARTAAAKIEKPNGKYLILSDDNPQVKAFSKKFFNLASSTQIPKEKLAMAQTFTALWKKCGYSLDATFYHFFKGLSLNQYLEASRNGALNTLSPLIAVCGTKADLERALQEGVLSRASAIAYFEATIKARKAQQEMGM